MSKEKVLPSIFFTELDAILDTRMGTILRIDSRSVERIIKSGYFHRDRDRFIGINDSKFKELYKNRDKETLKASMMTPIVGFMRDFCKRTYEGNIETPFLKEPRIIVNTYPYKLTKEEKDILLSGIQYKIGRISHAELTYMSYDQITPKYLKQETSIIALYDPYQWLENHSVSEVFKKESCPDVMMLGPSILRNTDVQDIDLDEFRSQMELLSKPFVDLQLFNVKAFSADVIDKSKPTEANSKEEKTEETT